MVSPTVQGRLDGALVHACHSSNLLDAHFLQVEERDAGALPFVQLCYGAVQRGHLLGIMVGLYGQCLQGRR